MSAEQPNGNAEEAEEEGEVENSGAATSSQDQAAVGNVPEAGNHGNPTKMVDLTAKDTDVDETEDETEWNREEIDGLFCPICMEGWTVGGDHQVCCIPCGHIYGKSCIKKWLQQLGSRGKCPQCNRKCKVSSIRALYASRVVAIDEGMQKQVRSLEFKCASLEKKDADWSKKELEWQKRERDLQAQTQNLKKSKNYLEGLLRDAETRNLELLQEFNTGNNFNAECGSKEYSNGYILLRDLQIEGARFFDVDALGQALIVARRLSGLGGRYTLTKISLHPPHDREDIQLPANTKVVKDLQVSPHARLAMLATLGKKLSVYSTESNNTVLTYDLPAAAWSCAWDVEDSHYLYAGLQSGMLLEFDLRQTSRPVESIAGLTCNPIHTVHSLSADSAFSSGVGSVLTASSSGLCHWNFGCSEQKSFLIPESTNQGVCISLAYGPGCRDIVATFRPKIEAEGPISLSQQPMSTQSSSLLGQAVQGTHVHYRRVGISSYQKLQSTSANVNGIRLPRSTIIDRTSQKSCFAAGDEASCDLVLQELPTLKVVQRVKSVKHPIRNVKYSRAANSGLLSCLSDETLLLYACNPP